MIFKFAKWSFCIWQGYSTTIFFPLHIFFPPKLIVIYNTMQNVGWREGIFQLHKGWHCRHLWIKSPRDYSVRELVTCSCPGSHCSFCGCPFSWALKQWLSPIFSVAWFGFVSFWSNVTHSNSLLMSSMKIVHNYLPSSCSEIWKGRVLAVYFSYFNDLY